jgi:hypothetical protein
MAQESIAREPKKFAIQDLLWLLDAPLFIDDKQVNSFYNAVVRPDIVDNPQEGGVSYAPAAIKIEVTKENLSKIAGKLNAEVGFSLGQLLSTLFPSAEAKVSGEVGGEEEQKAGKTTTIELHPVENPQRQLIHLAAHYLDKQTERLFLVNRPSDEDWRNPATILQPPRALVFLDLPPTIIIPAAAEFENNKIELLFQNLVAESGEKPPPYPESPKVAEADLPEARRAYWKWFRDHFRGSTAIRVIEEAAAVNGKIRWIAYRMPLNDEGDTLHLHISPHGKYDTGVLAYNFIKRGQKHGLRIVGTLKSEPDINVLAIYEK